MSLQEVKPSFVVSGIESRVGHFQLTRIPQTTFHVHVIASGGMVLGATTTEKATQGEPEFKVGNIYLALECISCSIPNSRCHANFKNKM